MNNLRKEHMKDKKRIVIKIGSSSLTHKETGDLNLMKIEKLVRVISDLKGQGKEVVLVSSGAIAAGRQALGNRKRPETVSEKQAYAAVGQARLMMVYQKLFPNTIRRLPRSFSPKTPLLWTTPGTMPRTPSTSF